MRHKLNLTPQTQRREHVQPDPFPTTSYDQGSSYHDHATVQGDHRAFVFGNGRQASVEGVYTELDNFG